MNSESKKLKVVVLTHGGCESLLQGLLKIDLVHVVGVFVETEISPRKYGLREQLERSIRYDGYTSTVKKLARLVSGRRNKRAKREQEISVDRSELETLTVQSGIPLHYLANYHSEESIDLIKRSNADLGIIWGTNILKESVFKIPRLGSINIHQGLAPYYRGGPPVFWELYNGETEVGITVHFVEAKVDTGAIITQEKVPLNYDYNYGLDYESFIADFRKRISTNCVKLMTEATRMIADGTVQTRQQDISLGKRYRLPVKQEKDELRRVLLKRASAAGHDTYKLIKMKRK
ncbi:MAG: hypothetical protein IPG76_13760 [Acidobacteria bacterium]|nr:hypothetical protein [Acidobacteriota bacterium]